MKKWEKINPLPNDLVPLIEDTAIAKIGIRLTLNVAYYGLREYINNRVSGVSAPINRIEKVAKFRKWSPELVNIKFATRNSVQYIVDNITTVYLDWVVILNLRERVERTTIPIITQLNSVRRS